MMKKRKLGIIGGSGLYKMDGFDKTKWKKIKTAWGAPSDEILLATIGKEEICFIPRHSRGHKINPSNINFIMVRVPTIIISYHSNSTISNFSLSC